MIELIFDVIFEAFVSAFAEQFIALAALLVPDGRLSKKATGALKIASAVLGIAMLFFFIAGPVMILTTDGISITGIVFTALAVLYIAAAVVLSGKRKDNKKK